MNIRHAICLPLVDIFGHARIIADLAREAEAAGWGGVFAWDDVAGWEADMADPTMALAAAALAAAALAAVALAAVALAAARAGWAVGR